jgi:hypothetical protein
MSFFPTADDWFTPSPGSQGHARRARSALVPLLVGGALTVVALAGRSRMGAWLRGFFSVRRPLPTQGELTRRLEEGLPLPLLRDLLLGRRKVAVAELVGPPRTAVMTRPSTGPVGQGAFWLADVWYYAIEPASQTAMAVTFDEAGVAREVDFFDAPRPGDSDVTPDLPPTA